MFRTVAHLVTGPAAASLAFAYFDNGLVPMAQIVMPARTSLVSLLVLGVWAPSVGLADDASFGVGASYSFSISEATFDTGGPATLGVDYELTTSLADSFSELFLEGIASGTDSDGVDGVALSGSVAIDGMASDPFGVAEGLADSIVVVDLANLSADPITFTLEYVLSASSDAVFAPPGSPTADAAAFSAVDISVSADDFGDLYFDALEAATDALFDDPPVDLTSGVLSTMFAVGPGETVFIEAYAEAFGFAEVLPEPVSGVLALGALVGVACARRR